MVSCHCNCCSGVNDITPVVAALDSSATVGFTQTAFSVISLPVDTRQLPTDPLQYCIKTVSSLQLELSICMAFD